MAFQFYCPHGHLLQGDETQIGQPCMCPYCQTEFTIPEPAGGVPATPGAPVMPGGEAYEEEYYEEEEEHEEEPVVTREDRLGAKAFFGFGEDEEEEGEEQDISDAGRIGDRIPDVDDPGNLFEGRAKTDPDIFHIPCPKGHVLETPKEMLNQEAICPICEREFVLRWDRSIEGQREKAIKEERLERRLGNFWMNWAIAAAVVVLFGILVMVAIIAGG